MNKKQRRQTKVTAFIFLVLILAAFYILSQDFRASVSDIIGFSEPSQIPDDTSQIPDDAIEVHVIDVGQGDSILIKSDECSVLIDAGPNSTQNELASYLRAQQISRIDCLILTHPHEDHIGGADYIVQNFEIDSILMPDCSASSKSFENLLDAIEEKNYSVSIPQRGDKFVLDNINFTVLAPMDKEYEETNDYSIALKAEYLDTSFILTGDAEKLSENEMLEYFGEDFLDCDVFKAGHHGSSTSNSKTFVKALSPKFAAISCGLDNDYGHPHREVRSLFDELEIEYFRTDYDSDIVFISDGKDVYVK